MGTLLIDMLTPKDVADILHVDTKTLANWRYLRRGPAYFKDGRVIRYPRAGLTAWLTSGTVKH